MSQDFVFPHSDGGQLDRLKQVVADIDRMPSRQEVAFALAYVVERFAGALFARELWEKAHELQREFEKSQDEEAT